MSQYEFQINTQTEAESQQFMEAINAEDISIEVWINDRDLPTQNEECIAFGITTLTPEELEQRAAEHGVELVYVESVQEADAKAEAIFQRVMQTYNIASSQEPTTVKGQLSKDD